ncbi:FAD-dependent oxidoreductase [Turicimonas muris]|uniref:FAD-dependent oxidoreductase n=1 Tax=Turicimonas muris TaxID=1796652 RepID=UPI002495A7A4|nr:flavocytochrome c [Turicimonas muris]
MVTRRQLCSVVPSVAIGLLSAPLKAGENRIAELEKPLRSYIIAGAGVSGLIAAITAAEHGVKDILVIEKEPLIGGASILCEGVWTLAGTPFQKETGLADSSEKFLENLIEDAKGTNDPKLLKAYIDHCLDQYEWFARKGIHPKEIITNTGMNVPRGHTFDPLQIIICLRKRLNELGIALVTGAKAKKLLLKADGAVAGLLVESKGKTFKISSKLGVLLATGGFSRNTELIAKYAPKMINAVRLSCAGAYGDGLIMALEAGADVRDIHNIRAAYGFILNPSSVFDISQTIYAGAISVNSQGLRYVNESLPYKDIGEIALEQPSQRTFMVFDSLILKAQMEDRAADARLYAPLLKGETPIFMSAAASLEELARTARLPVANFVSTVSRYNTYVDKGFDEEFGRRHLTLTYGTMRKIQKAPFYLVPTTCASMGTNGGVRVNEKTQVLKADLSAIPGLYAAGEMMGGFHGNSFMGGTSYGKAIVFGRINGLYIAEENSRA